MRPLFRIDRTPRVDPDELADLDPPEDGFDDEPDPLSEGDGA
ncbi:hypothetical protein [Thalassobius vesicularis]|nr:hypothetical protein [Thalassobius vesicularis]